MPIEKSQTRKIISKVQCFQKCLKKVQNHRTKVSYMHPGLAAALAMVACTLLALVLIVDNVKKHITKLLLCYVVPGLNLISPQYRLRGGQNSYGVCTRLELNHL